MKLELSTGKKVYANGLIFGLTRDLLLTEGYDGFIFDDTDDPLTPAEKCEIADVMMKRWQSYKAVWG
jgi:phage major head subunit gpT-like protein